MGKTVERIVNAERVEDLIAVFGSFDENIKRIEEALGVHVINRGTDLRISGEEEAADKAVRTLEGLLQLASKGEVIDEQRVRYLITLVREGNDDSIAQMAKDVVCITAKGKPIKAKTVGQQKYMKAIQKNTITIKHTLTSCKIDGKKVEVDAETEMPLEMPLNELEKELPF